MKTIQQILAAVLAALSLNGLANAATVSILLNSNPDQVGAYSPKFTESNGTLLTLGDIVRVGYFDLTNASVVNTLQTSNNYNEINALFTYFGAGQFGGGSVLQADNTGQTLVINDSFKDDGGPGNVFGAIQNIDSTFGNIPTGARLSVWVFNASDPKDATEWGIFSAASGWNCPNALGVETLSTFEVGNTPSEVLRGTLDVGTEQLRLATIAAVPEPGGITLLLAAGFLVRRRRR